MKIPPLSRLNGEILTEIVNPRPEIKSPGGIRGE
jgi:hypothetical protein